MHGAPQQDLRLHDSTVEQLLVDEWGSPQGLLEQSSPARSRPYLPDHGAPVVDELRQHHGHVVVDGGGVVGPLS